MDVDLVAWSTPRFVTAVLPPGKRENGFTPPMQWKISEVDADTLAAQCDRFRAEVFQRAGKQDPALRDTGGGH